MLVILSVSLRARRSQLVTWSLHLLHDTSNNYVRLQSDQMRVEDGEGVYEEEEDEGQEGGGVEVGETSIRPNEIRRYRGSTSRKSRGTS